MLRIYHKNTAFLSDPEIYAQVYGSLSVHRQKNADRYRLENGRLLSVCAGALLDEALREYGLKEADMEYLEGPHGKPSFANAPDIHFSISHSHEEVMLAISDAPVGCDIEQVRTMKCSIVERFFSPCERSLILSSLPDAGETAAEGRPEYTGDAARAFFRIWTLKESFMKVTGMGLSLGPEQFSIKITDGSPITVKGRGKDDFGGIFDADYDFAEYDLIPGYCMSSCVLRR